MPREDKYIRDLLKAWVKDNLNDQQTEELFQYLSNHPAVRKIVAEVTETYKNK
jgi:hypothetical protein